ncbi:MAG: MlaE family lipid ABC transporter permease subunit [Candidatus Cloacimonadales bacterium]
MKISEQTIYLDGKLDRFIIKQLSREIEQKAPADFQAIDLSQVSTIDSAGVAFVDSLRHLSSADKVDLVGAKPEIAAAIDTFSDLNLPDSLEKKADNIFVKIGSSLLDFWAAIVAVVYLLADIFFWSFVGIFNHKGQRKGSVIHQSLLIGADALGIIALLSFILGLILALQSAAQLRQFGANIFVADLMGISMVTEMGPILTSIILAGRTGSSIASEIATMKVTEEIDALKMMAINPIRYIVVPKFHAITICIPLLVTASTLIGIFGGLIVAVVYLDLSWISFVNRIFEVLTLKDVFVGLGKSFFFAWAIVIIGTYYGFNVQGGAEGVGKVTTQAVVAAIFWVIILDAINSIIFYF